MQSGHINYCPYVFCKIYKRNATGKKMFIRVDVMKNKTVVKLYRIMLLRYCLVNQCYEIGKKK